MTYKQIVDRITANVQAGIKTDETRFGREFVVSHINSARAVAIQQAWMKFKRINPQWLQEYEFKYSEDLQSDVKNTCITKYNIPGWISLDGKTDGMLFVGNSDNKQFRIFNSRPEFSSYLNIKSQSPYGGRYIGVVREGNFMELHYKSRIKFGRMLMIYQSPLDCKTYSIDFDPYPVTEEIVSMMEDLLMRKFISMSQQPIDSVSNKNDSRVAQTQPFRPQN